MSNPLPAKCLLLDIEGTTSSISFVHEVMFPFALEHLGTFLDDHFEEPEVQRAGEQIAQDANFAGLQIWSDTLGKPAKVLVAEEVRSLMAQDVKATGLKSLQGLIWKSGFDSGELQSHVYEDVLPAIQKWREAGGDVRIYSSGSIAAQKLFFGHVAVVGNCLGLFSGHYDTTFGGKKEVASYERIAADWAESPQDILFVSDVTDELDAASRAGMQTRLSLRPGNAPVAPGLPFESIESFMQLF